MIRKIDIGTPASPERFADPTPLGLICLAIGCAALVPIAFGARLTPTGLRTAAMFCLLFGAGGQAVAGLLNLANRNLYGGTLFTAFAFNWVLNWWVLDGLAKGSVPDSGIVLAADVCFLVIFAVFTYGFGFYSGLLFGFLLDIDLLYACRIANSVLATRAFDFPIALFTVGLAGISLWIAFALLINPTAGRVLFSLAGPLFRARPRPVFDVSRRRAIFDVLYRHWSEHAFRALPIDELVRSVQATLGDHNLAPELAYLEELGALRVGRDGTERISHLRLTAAGIDFYEQVALKKSSFA